MIQHVSCGSSGSNLSNELAREPDKRAGLGARKAQACHAGSLGWFVVRLLYRRTNFFGTWAGRVRSCNATRNCTPIRPAGMSFSGPVFGADRECHTQRPPRGQPGPPGASSAPAGRPRPPRQRTGDHRLTQRGATGRNIAVSLLDSALSLRLLATTFWSQTPAPPQTRRFCPVGSAGRNRLQAFRTIASKASRNAQTKPSPNIAQKTPLVMV